jgi:hypothetical protein
MEHSEDMYPARYCEISSPISANKFQTTTDRYSGTQPSTKGTTIAPPGLSVAASHRQAGAGPLRVASGPPDAPNRVNLARGSHPPHTRAAPTASATRGHKILRTGDERGRVRRG